MTKYKMIVYWVATAVLALGMLGTGIMQLLRVEFEATLMNHLGYPPYIMTILGICKMLGVPAILIPRSPLLKEYAYAGFFFMMMGAVSSHIACGDNILLVLPSVVMLVSILLSWYYRPLDKKIDNMTEYLFLNKKNL